ncbi:MAG: chemotaxis protein CheA, partial [Peptococcaceae bacterium]|nr:chemotaxis protein CheA [Peptococcaceae bacterium]
PAQVDCAMLSDLVLSGIDFTKVELAKVKNGDTPDGEATQLMQEIRDFLQLLKQTNFPAAPPPDRTPAPVNQQYYISSDRRTPHLAQNLFKAVIFFEDDCEMENIRAYSIVHNLKEFTSDLHYVPVDIIDNDASVAVIRENGFTILLKTDSDYAEIHKLLNNTAFLKDFELIELADEQEFVTFQTANNLNPMELELKLHEQLAEKVVLNSVPKAPTELKSGVAQSIISVNVDKLDKLMDLVGELVIAEAMVTQNPDLTGLELDNFHKAARQLRKISGELQDMVMSIRMVPLATTFQKMHRILRDMSKRLGKEVTLEIVGEQTEVDKNIIEHISDPLMHLVRNSIDHGIESNQQRLAAGKTAPATITLEATNAGGDVLILVKDNGKGLDQAKILQRAEQHGLLNKPAAEMSDREIYNLIFLPGFSTQEQVTEFSGRGVGMDVVVKNIEAVGGCVLVDSTPGEGTKVTLKIPLTLAIIDGMNIRVGNSRYTLPTTSIKESFRPKPNDIITDPNGNEVIMVRGQCFPVLRLHDLYQVATAMTDFTEGILIMVEQDTSSICLYADELLGQQQVVVKTLPNYIKSLKKITGLSGCTLLGDGSISLILDVGGLLEHVTHQVRS